MNDFWLGIIGVAVGTVGTILAQWVLHYLKTAGQRKRDKKRKALLEQMLNNPGPKGWRKMTTMSGVIGADREETARLLIEMDARANEKEEGNDVWAYVKDKPLPHPKK